MSDDSKEYLLLDSEETRFLFARFIFYCRLGDVDQLFILLNNPALSRKVLQYDTNILKIIFDESNIEQPLWFLEKFPIEKRKEIRTVATIRIFFYWDDLNEFLDLLLVSNFLDEAKELQDACSMYKHYCENKLTLEKLKERSHTHIQYSKEGARCKYCKNISKFPTPIRVALTLIPPFKDCTKKCNCVITEITDQSFLDTEDGSLWG